MSRIEELKKQNPFLFIDWVDIINKLTGKSKYTEMLINLIKNVRVNQLYSQRRDYESELKDMCMVNKQLIDNLNIIELVNMVNFLSANVGYQNLKMFKEFIDLSEKNLIENKDLTTYKTFEEVELQISMSSMKLIDKEMEKQVEKLYETDEWLVIKPLSYPASLKYGASTKWCTSSKDNPDYYFKYTKSGILIYAINKKTGNKVAGFKSLDSSYGVETSFWNITDQRIDSMESNLPNEVLSIFKSEFLYTKQPNWDVLTDEEKNSQNLWLQEEYYIKSSLSEPIRDNPPHPYLEETPVDYLSPPDYLRQDTHSEYYDGPSVEVN